jgi:hypothetical protein
MAAADRSMGGTSRLMPNHHSLSLRYSQRYVKAPKAVKADGALSRPAAAAAAMPRGIDHS